MTDDLQILDDVSIELVKYVGNDRSVVDAARVSTQGERVLNGEWNHAVGREIDELSNQEAGLINYLMRDRHGSPFEHNSMTFFIKAPMVVFWQLTRHRAGWSYNIESARYREMGNDFYIPDRDRPLVQRGKAGSYDFKAGDYNQYVLVSEQLMKAYEQCWDSYQTMLEGGICREVARLALPFGVYFTGYATCNARSLMHFLSLRTKSEDAVIKSSPQHEINVLAQKLEFEWSQIMPVTHEKFVANGRVGP